MAIMTRGRKWTLGALIATAGIAGLSQLWWPINAAQDAPPLSLTSAPAPDAPPVGAIRVSTIHPSTGGAARRTTLPCAARWHENAELFAKVSGYLEELKVDIGSRVKQGDVLAVVAVPELESDIRHASATEQHALAAVVQAQARKKSASAAYRVAEAACAKAEADVERWVAEQTFREKEYDRFRELNRADSVQAALVDEKLFQLQSVRAGLRSGEAAVLTAKEQLAEAAAKVELAEADLGLAQAQAGIAKALVNKATLYASFARIISPYDGVVTTRNFHRGDFIRAADKGSMEPLLMVGRTDLIRVVVHIPDRDVPFAQSGDSVEIEFDSLPGKKLTGALSRIAHSEDSSTRSMRAEVDLPNAEGIIVDQMYGRMTIELEPAGKTMTLPSVCLVGNLHDNQGQVYVVRNGVAQLQSVAVGAHDGINAEILSGLSPNDEIVIRPPAGLTDGTKVSSEPASAPPRT